MSLQSMCRDTVTQKRKSNTKDASGGMTMTFATVTSDIACDIQPASASVRMQYMQMNEQATYTIYLTEDITAYAGDIFVNSESRTFQFRGKRKPATGYNQWPAIIDVEEQA